MADGKVLIAPSILSADFARLGDQIREVEAAGADLIHVDVMDGHFVPNLTLGPLVVEAIRKETDLPLDVHLMIDNPEDFVEAFAEAGADMISVHVEATNHLHRLIQSIRAFPKVKAGVAVNPGTPMAQVTTVLGEVDFVLIMSVNPGFGGQEFIPSSIEKIASVRRGVEEKGLNVSIEVDGGIAVSTARAVIQAGAEILVAGSAIFGAPDIRQAVRNLKEVATA
ncbi:MAG: ribulose-phosphate 3-epimerase [Candidatus Aquicultorales bacterium]